MDDHFNCNLCTMCVIAKSNWYIQNVKDWRSEFINQDFLNCILKWPFPVIAIMGYTKMLQRLNAKRCKIFYCCNIEKKKIMPKFSFKCFFSSLLHTKSNEQSWKLFDLDIKLLKCVMVRKFLTLWTMSVGIT